MSDAQFMNFMETVGNITNSIQRLVNHVANKRADIPTVPDSVSIKTPEVATALVLKTTSEAAPASETYTKLDVAPSSNTDASNVDIIQQKAPLISGISSHSCRVLCNGTRNCNRIEMSLILNGNLQANFEFDTGAGACIIPKAWLTLFSPERRPVLHPCDVKLDLANGQLAKITGVVHIDVITSACKRMKPVNTIFYVVDGPHALLGRPLIQALFPGLYNNMTNLSGALDHYHGDKNYIQVPPVTMVAKSVPI